MREFKYLVVGRSGAPKALEERRTKANTVLLAVKKADLVHRPVIWSQKNYHYYVFENVDEFVGWYEGKAVEDRHFYEVIFGEMPQRLKLDLDHVVGELGEIMEAIRRAWEGLYGTQMPTAPALYLFRTSAEGFHVIIDHVVPNVGAAKAFAERVKAELSTVLQTPGPSPVDMAVFATTQNFRIWGSSKPPVTGLDSTPRMVKTLINGQKINLRDTLIRVY